MEALHGMRNYLRENIERYRRMARTGGPADCAGFSSRGFLDDVIPRLCLRREHARVLELGTGIGPGAIYLAERGFAVHAVDVIPEAIAQARRAAAERGLDVRFEVMDVTRIPHEGPAYDLIVDSYCLQGIVLDADREAVFGAVKARLHPRGHYLVSSAMYAATRHRPDRQVVDGRTGRVFDRYDEASLFDPATDIYYQPWDGIDGREKVDGAIRVNGSWYSPFRRYRTGPRLRAELESHGFKVIHQSGELGQNLVADSRESWTRAAHRRGRESPASPMATIDPEFPEKRSERPGHANSRPNGTHVARFAEQVSWRTRLPGRNHVPLTRAFHTA